MIAPGLLATVQDLGRFGFAHFGISAAGAADAFALRAGNLLVGNPPGAAAIEMTLLGGDFEFDAATCIALTGAVPAGDLRAWRAMEWRAGEVLRCGPFRSGARLYLCVRGGIDVPRVMGSASTHLASATGGYQGRALRKGDVLAIGDAAVRPPCAAAALPMVDDPGTLRVIPGADAGALCATTWTVAEQSDRTGIRLRGAALPAPAGAMLTHGVAPGAVQLPPSGQPIVLFVDHGTTGGYPVIAHLITADLSRAAQLRPRDAVRCQAVTLEEARAALRRQQEWLHALA